MIKIKSKSREFKQIEPANRYAFSKRASSKQNRLLKTAECRHQSNQYISLANNFTDQAQNIKIKEFSCSKHQKKQQRLTEVQLQTNKFSNHELKQSKKCYIGKTFIGIKLRKKLQKYLLFLSLINYSLRVNYEKPDVNKYRVFVGQGNNSKLVKQIFSNRYWWSTTRELGQANLVWTQRAKKKIFASITNLDKGQINQEIGNNLGKRKLKVKNRESKKHFIEEELQVVLCERDRLLIKGECKKQNFLQQLKSFIKRHKNEKRKAVKVTHNHLQHHRLLTNKKNLFYNMKKYCEQHGDNLFNYIPLTFHVKKSEENEYQAIAEYEEKVEGKKMKEKLMWIVKPGQNSNRGTGIEICKKLEQVRKHIEKERMKHPDRTFIVQKYITPFLFHRRKFDIRCFVLVTATPLITAYFYPIGYIRTSSFQFSMKNCSNKYIHLTNDAIQKKATEYSKYESGNKITFQEFQKYLNQFEPDKQANFFTDILPFIKDLVKLSIKSARNFEQSQKEHTFEILGYDFMIDEEMQPWLIQINTNPCLQTGCKILNDLIPTMLQNAVKIAVDPIFKPPKIEQWSLNELLSCSNRLFQNNKFQLIYSQLHQQ